MSYPYIVQGNNITVVIGNTPHTISKTHITYQRVLEAIKAGDWETVKDVIEPKKLVVSFGAGNVSIEGEQLFWKGRELHNSLSVRMIAMLQEGFSVEPLANFMENLMSNPSKRAVQELYGFLEKNNLPITPDGHFLAYKKIKNNYTDCYTGTMDNSIGKIVEMERNEVDDNKDQTCSTGLHFCSHSYLSHFGGDRVVIVKINPRDVVSIPSDYNDAKGRACRYEVIGEVDVNPEDQVEFTRSVQSNANSVDEAEDWEMDGGEEVDEDLCDPFDEMIDYVTGAIPGDGIFHRGYEDGYKGNPFNPQSHTPTGEKFYKEGFAKGKDTASWGINQEYVYTGPAVPSAKPFAHPKTPWPFPKA